MSEKLLCGDCSLQSIEQSDRREVCGVFVRDVISQWWGGDPTLELHDVAMDNYFYYRSSFSANEEDLMNNCFTEHSSDRCQNLNP